MHRVDTADYEVVGGKRRYKDTPTPPTVYGHNMANAIQEEVVGVIENEGLTLRASGDADETAGWGQLDGAINKKVQDLDDDLQPQINTNASNIVNNTSVIDNHIADTTDAHNASAISVVPDGIASDNVQDALDELAASKALESIIRGKIDGFITVPDTVSNDEVIRIGKGAAYGNIFNAGGKYKCIKDLGDGTSFTKKIIKNSAGTGQYEFVAATEGVAGGGVAYDTDDEVLDIAIGWYHLFAIMDADDNTKVDFMLDDNLLGTHIIDTIQSDEWGAGWSQHYALRRIASIFIYFPDPTYLIQKYKQIGDKFLWLDYILKTESTIPYQAIQAPLQYITLNTNAIPADLDVVTIAFIDMSTTGTGWNFWFYDGRDDSDYILGGFLISNASTYGIQRFKNDHLITDSARKFPIWQNKSANNVTVRIYIQGYIDIRGKDIFEFIPPP